MRPLNRRNQRGVSLIEVQVSMIVLAAGILAMAALQLRVLHQTKDQHQRDLAIWQAQAIVDRISLNNSQNAIDQYIVSISDDELCDELPPVICAESYDDVSGLEIVATACSDTELAEYDSWEVICYTNNNGGDNVSSLDDFSLRENLDIQTLSLSCALNQNPCPIGADLTLTVQWLSQSARLDSRLTGTTIITDSVKGIEESVAANVETYRQVFIP